MNVHVPRSVVMTVLMKVDTVAPWPPKYVGAEANQHDANRGLEWPGETQRDRVVNKRPRVTPPPLGRSIA
jgi:hypothetical protein